MKQFIVKGHNWVSLNRDFNLYLVITRLTHKLKTSGWLQGHLSLSSFWYWSNEYKKNCLLVVALSSVGAVTPHPQKILYIYIYIYISCLGKLHSLCVLFHELFSYIYIVIKEKTNKIFKVKIFQLLPLAIHKLSLYKFRFESHIRLNSLRARCNVAQGTNRTRFNFYNKNW